MTGRGVFCGGVCAVAFFSVVSMTAHAGDIKWDQGSWRLELAGYAGLDSPQNQRNEDFGALVTVEREFPLWKRATLGIRLHPLFYYDQEQDDPILFRRFRNSDNFNPDYDDDTVWGVGLGPSFRVYQKAEERRGLFLELGVSALFHDEKFVDNSSNVNFISEVGVGYKFQHGWHVAAKLRHISNAGFGDDNSATNGWGIGVGYSF